MTTDLLRKIIFYLLIGGKFLVFAWLVVLWITNSYTDVQAVELVKLILPLFAVNFTVAINYWLKHWKDETGQDGDVKVNGPIRFSAVFFSIAYTLCLLFFLGYYATRSGTPASFASAKNWILVVEILFGAYLGLIINALYTPKAV